MQDSQVHLGLDKTGSRLIARSYADKCLIPAADDSSARTISGVGLWPFWIYMRRMYTLSMHDHNFCLPVSTKRGEAGGNERVDDCTSRVIVTGRGDSAM